MDLPFLMDSFGEKINISSIPLVIREEFGSEEKREADLFYTR